MSKGRNSVNILYIAPQKIVSGASLSLIGLVKNLSIKHNITVIVEDCDTEYAKRLADAGAEIIVFPIPVWLKYKPKCGFKWQLIKFKWILVNSIIDLRLIPLIKKLREKNIDIVHSNLRITNIGGKIAKYLNVPHVWHIREYGEEDFHLYPVFSYKYTYNFMNKYGDKVIAIADGVKDKYSSFFGDKIIKISNGIDIDLFKKGKHEIFDSDKITIGMTSIISETKGQREFLHAIADLDPEKRKKLSIKIVGACYDESLLEELLNFINQNHMTDQVEFTGHVKNVSEILEKLDILVVASKMEAFGRVTVEGMVAGCLVIGANTAGTKEILQNGRLGLIYQNGNIRSLSEQIELAIDNPNKMRKLAEEGRDYATANYSDKRNAEQIEKVYLQLLKG